MITSANTSVNCRKLPAIYTNKAAQKIYSGKSVIDLGCGKFDNAKHFAESLGCEVGMYDPYNRTLKENQIAVSRKYDVAIISNVLNVIQDSLDRWALIDMASVLAPTILVTVYEGDGTGVGRQTKPDCWQENRPTESYVGEIAGVLPEYSVTRKGKLIIAEKERS